MEYDDREIIEGCKRKDKKFQKILYDKYAQHLFAVCLRNTRCKEDAEDIFQEAFVKAFNSLEKYSYQGSFISWLTIMFKREAWNYYRGKKTQFSKVELDDSNIPTYANDILEEYSNEQLLNCLQRLEDKERIILVMYAIDGATWEEIAEFTQFEVATVRSMFSRAKKKVVDMFYNL